MLSEDERLAYATMALLHRGDISAADLARALDPLRDLAAVRHRLDPNPRAHSRLNAVNYLRALSLQLDLGVRPMPWHDDKSHFAKPPHHRQEQRRVVNDALLPFPHWYGAPASASPAVVPC
ncbi:MAG TPA: DUF2785 domain-containing protein [Candidatus Limnocylindrales bacterium]